MFWELIEGADKHCFLDLRWKMVLPFHVSPFVLTIFIPVLQLSLCSFYSSSLPDILVLSVFLSSLNACSGITGCGDSLGSNSLLLSLLCTRTI